MKDYYKISEISKLYGIGADSLRYYERAGIITPKRGENGYRLYGLKDIYKLSVLRDLMALDFSVAQAKEYLDGQNVGKTLALLRRESGILSERLRELAQKKELIEERIAVLSAARTIKAGEATVKNLQERSCVRISERITRDEEMDFVIKKLHMKHADKIRDLGNQTIGAFFSSEALAEGRANVYDSVFFVLDGPCAGGFTLPAGEYLSYFYRGGYAQNAARLRELADCAAALGFRAAGEPFELYEIDNRDTMLEEEFLTEIQMRVERAAPDKIQENSSVEG